MLTFLLSTLGGAVIGGSYVLIRTPRSGKDNQEFVKNFMNNTKKNLDDVTHKASNLENSLTNLTLEIKNIQKNVVPDLVDIVQDFEKDAKVSNRRIQDEMHEINREINSLNLKNE